MMRNKLVISLVVFVTMITTSIIASAETSGESSERKECTTEPRTYYFALGSNSKKGSSQTRTDTTTFDDNLPDDAEVIKVDAVAKQMTSADFGDYIDLIRGDNCSSEGPSGAPICSDEENNKYTNSGTEDGWSNFTSITDDTDIDQWFQDSVVQPNIGEGLTSVNCSPAGKGIVECTITRTWDDSSNSDETYTVPVAADITITYLAENCGEDEETPEEEICEQSDSGATIRGTSCGTNSYEGYKKVNLNITRTISEGTSDFSEHQSRDPKIRDKGDGFCTSDITQTITGSTTIEQTGNAKIMTSPHSIYAGGGFYFNVNYMGKAKYDICGTISYSTYEYYFYYDCSGYSGDKVEQVGTKGEKCNIYEKKQEQRYKQNCEPSYWDDCTYNHIYFELKEQKDAIKKCGYTKTHDGTCNQNGTSLSCDLCDGEEETKKVAQEMSKYVKIPSSDNYKLTARDSNNAQVATTNANWYDWNINGQKPSEWRPDTYITYRVSLNQKKACINRKTAKVEYKNSCSEDEVDGETLYYVPLKYFGSEFKIKVNLPELSIINSDTQSIMNWSLDANCGPGCYQKIYEPNGKYKFVYRPINMNNPFPGRSPGSNWTEFMSDASAVADKMNRDTLEYEITMDGGVIRNIKQYNDVGGRFYTSLANISNRGKSSFLDGYPRLYTAQYNSLGECNNECWGNPETYSGF